MECYNGPCLTPTTGTAPQTFAAALQFLAAAQCAISEGLIPDANVTNYETFDFIIVGAGTAGCVLANRLSAVSKWKILLIEAGGDAPIEANVPGLDKGMFNTRYDWGYLTNNNGVTNGGNINASIRWPRGKMMGGSSNLNAMIYVQGNDQDFQNWVDLGNPEWAVKEVRRCFKKAESYQNMELLKNPEIRNHYGHDGPLAINTFNSTFRPITNRLLSAWNEVGFKNVPDLNVAKMLGSGILTATAAGGERQSHNKAYNASCPTPTTGAAPQTFASAFQFFAAAQCLITEGLIPDAEVRNFDKFDFIIVGAGTAGSVLANRLSAVPELNILLIEAGDNAPVEANIPDQDKFLIGSKYDWKYLTAKNSITNGANIDESIIWSRGKMIGGCSNMNAMVYIQGNDQDFQNWVDLDFEKFDFIIVGAGTAGSVLANRLSAVPEWKILLIEAGDDAPMEANIPDMDKVFLGSKYDWNYLTAKNGITNGANIDESIVWLRAKMMGGCSNINAMVYIQGTDQDFQNWVDLGNAEWSVEEEGWSGHHVTNLN
ncbi:hypothetical protein PYW07_017280 [Mythimna separata]|uniref:Glucose-methanol-choline oxidoreductase N-terminal domain-containing protein n=1 Tax=Mythimna separata TaxID=271217 RepID=A0AAD7YV12_MYTSE|nr:hypothetical protein PYW07_017280 [Mythimna separata]